MTKELILKISAISLAAVALCCFVLSACSSTATTHMLDNLAGCERHYDGAVSGGMTGGQFSGTVKIDCLSPQTGVPQPTATPAELPPKV